MLGLKQHQVQVLLKTQGRLKEKNEEQKNNHLLSLWSMQNCK